MWRQTLPARIHCAALEPPRTHLWRGPRWALALLLAGLGTLGPFSIDAYLPAFASIATDLQATPLQMQQTLSAYLLGFAAMNLFHGALADSFGRRPVVLAGWRCSRWPRWAARCPRPSAMLVACRALAGAVGGGGHGGVARHHARHVRAGRGAAHAVADDDVVRLAPALAPLVGGCCFVHAGWHAIFWLLAAVGSAAVAGELAPAARDAGPAACASPSVRCRCCAVTAQMVPAHASWRWWWPAACPFNGMFLYVLSARCSWAAPAPGADAVLLVLHAARWRA
jgi:DHA1 family bicyclomycin/chloramphenicol resistance-like MFS transporter